MAFSLEDLFEGLGKRKEVDTTTYYEILGVDKSASLAEIGKAYRNKARDIHPDRHPNEREKYRQLFQELQTVYETLSDPYKRQMYDKYGSEGVKNSNNVRKRQRQSPAIECGLDVTLSDLYFGKTKRIRVTRKLVMYLFLLFVSLFNHMLSINSFVYIYLFIFFVC